MNDPGPALGRIQNTWVNNEINFKQLENTYYSTGNDKQIINCTRDIDGKAPMSVAELTGLVGRIMNLMYRVHLFDKFHPP